MIIAIDVDITLVTQPIEDWIEHLKYNSTFFDEYQLQKDLANGVAHYDLTRYSDTVKDKQFWQQAEIYDKASISLSDKRKIEEWHNAGHQIVFVSYCFPEHERGKIAMLKREFPFLVKDFHFISTFSKGFVKCDVIIEDRNEHLNQFSEDVRKYLVKSPYKQNVDRKDKCVVVNSISEIEL